MMDNEDCRIDYRIDTSPVAHYETEEPVPLKTTISRADWFMLIFARSPIRATNS